jgi:putative endonuclease
MNTEAKLCPALPNDMDLHGWSIFEIFDGAEAAIAREKQLKKWRRDWKIALIEEANLDWQDLSNAIA